MKKGLILIALAASTNVISTGCFRQEMETIVVSVPQMGSKTCSQFLSKKLGPFEGIQRVQPNIEKRTVSVTYNSTKLARMNVKHLISEVGFQADDVAPDADAQAKLPAECR